MSLFCCLANISQVEDASFNNNIHLSHAIDEWFLKHFFVPFMHLCEQVKPARG